MTFSRRTGSRLNGRGRIAAAAGGVTELITLSTIAADAYGDTNVNTSILRGDNPVTDPATGALYLAYHTSDAKLALAKSTDGGANWTVDKSAIGTFPSDGHCFVSLGIDGDGDLLVSGDMHGEVMNFQRLTGGSIDITGWIAPPVESGATDEASVSYPLFAQRLSTGDILFLFRDGGAGNGNLVLKRWDHTLHTLVTVVAVVVNGEGVESFYLWNPYWNESTQELLCAGCWRNTTSLNTNHDLIFFRLLSSDNWATATAKKSDGSAQTLPITQANADEIATIAENTGLGNTGSVTVDSGGNYRVWSFRDPGDGFSQITVHKRDGGVWTEQIVPDDVQLRNGIPYSLIDVTGSPDRNMIIAPRAVCDGDRTIIPMATDTEGTGVWAFICERADCTQWTIRQIHTEDVGLWGPAADSYQWSQNGEIHTLVQRGKFDGEAPIGAQTLKYLKVRPQSAAYPYVAPSALFDPDDYAGCIAYIAPRVGGVKAQGRGAAADYYRVTALYDARDSSAFFVQATLSDAPELSWNRFGKRKGGVLFVAANADFMLSTQAAFLAAIGGVNTPFICSFVFETTTVVTTGMRIWSAGLDTNDYLSFGTTATNKFPVLERNVNGTVKQWVGNAALADSTEYVITAVFDGSTGYMRVNQVQQVAAADLAFAAAASYTHLSLGCRRRVTNDLHASGYLGPMRFGTTIPSAANIEAIEEALATEYGITL